MMHVESFDKRVNMRIHLTQQKQQNVVTSMIASFQSEINIMNIF